MIQHSKKPVKYKNDSQTAKSHLIPQNFFLNLFLSTCHRKNCKKLPTQLPQWIRTVEPTHCANPFFLNQRSAVNDVDFQQTLYAGADMTSQLFVTSPLLGNRSNICTPSRAVENWSNFAMSRTFATDVNDGAKRTHSSKHQRRIDSGKQAVCLFDANYYVISAHSHVAAYFSEVRIAYFSAQIVIFDGNCSYLNILCVCI